MDVGCPVAMAPGTTSAEAFSIGVADIIITSTGNKDVVTVDQMARMKHQAILGNIGHFDNEIDMAGLEKYDGVVRHTVKPQVDLWTFPEGNAIIVLSEGRLMNLGNATGHPSFVMSNSFTNQVLAQIELFTKPEPRRAAHRAHRRAGVLPRCVRPGALQAGAVPVLTPFGRISLVSLARLVA